MIDSVATTPGLDEYDPHSRLLRACALICVEKRALNSAHATGRPVSMANVCRFRRAMEKAAEHVYEEWVEPSAALWVLRMREEQALLADGRCGVMLKDIDSILEKGQKRCPWSKDLLLEAASHRDGVRVNEEDKLVKIVQAASVPGPSEQIHLRCHLLEAEAMILG